MWDLRFCGLWANLCTLRYCNWVHELHYINIKIPTNYVCMHNSPPIPHNTNYLTYSQNYDSNSDPIFHQNKNNPTHTIWYKLGLSHSINFSFKHLAITIYLIIIITLYYHVIVLCIIMLYHTIMLYIYHYTYYVIYIIYIII